MTTEIKFEQYLEEFTTIMRENGYKGIISYDSAKEDWEQHYSPEEAAKEWLEELM